jgi:hypothetical protein
MSTTTKQKTPWACRLFGHHWVRRGIVVVLGPDPGDMVCTSCGSTTWSVEG